MAPPILRSDRLRAFMQNRLSRCDNKVVAKVVIFRKTPTFAVLANGSAFGFFLFGTSRQNILCKHSQYLQMLCSFIFAAPYSQKSHTAARVAIFGSPVYRACTNIDAANSPFLPEAARNIEASLDIAEKSIFAIASKQKSPIPSRKLGACSAKRGLRKRKKYFYSRKPRRMPAVFLARVRFAFIKRAPIVRRSFRCCYSGFTQTFIFAETPSIKRISTE